MRLSELLTAAGLAAKHHGPDVDVASVTDDSRTCHGRECFVAVRGQVADGHDFISTAVSGGCAAVICEDARGVPADMPHVVLNNTHASLGALAQASLGWPSRKLQIVGVTGTNGKTTVTYLLESILAGAGMTTGRLGTIGYAVAGTESAATNTTPGAVRLAQSMAAMVSAGCSHLVMEVSSHALDQHRVTGVDFDVAIFTNLTGDHLDYHHTMDAYLAAKRRLFEGLAAEASAVLNRDDEASDSIAEATDARVSWYGLSPASDVRARIDRIDIAGTSFALMAGGVSTEATTSLIGRHNVMNCLAAAAGAAAMGVDLPTIVRGIGARRNVPGRLQRVPCDRPIDVFVDYAHTDDALTNVLSSLRPVTSGRLIVVFGCGGDRDRTKRPRMAAAAQQGADVLVVTSDNPRSEDPRAIIDEILAGLCDADRGQAVVQPDRREAIGQAVATARDGDVVLIAGKGHECQQIIGDTRIHFDDVEVAAEALAQSGSSP